MDWNAVTAVSTMASTAVVVVAAVIALSQLHNLRKTAQFDGTRRMIDHLVDPEFIRALRFVTHDLGARLGDAAYRDDLAHARGWDFDIAAHPEALVLARFEEIGIYVRNGLLPASALLDFNAELILEAWDHLQDVVALMRRSHRNPNVWSNAEYLHSLAKDHRTRSRR